MAAARRAAGIEILRGRQRVMGPVTGIIRIVASARRSRPGVTPRGLTTPSVADRSEHPGADGGHDLRVDAKVDRRKFVGKGRRRDTSAGTGKSASTQSETDASSPETIPAARRLSASTSSKTRRAAARTA